MSLDLDFYSTITNTCTCANYNEDTGDWEVSSECWGDCYTDSVIDFAEVVQPLLDANEDMGGRGYRIEGFPTWQGRIDGVFIADTAEELLTAITPSRTEWTLHYVVENGELIASLSHHDGSGRITVKPIGELQ